MIAKRTIPHDYLSWNRRWGAPFGRLWARRLPMGVRWRRPLRPWVGMFAFQCNNTTRAFEYPWCFHATPLAPGLRVLEIGGSLSGFQLLLSKLGMDVVNLDPGEDARGKTWPLSDSALACLNRAYGTRVKLERKFIEEADLEDESFDRVFAISVIEHIGERDLDSLMTHVRRVLKPDGLFVATIDLFLDLQPFTDRPSNEYGSNVSVRRLLEAHGFELASGDPSELYGFPEFDADRIRDRVAAAEFLVGSYPLLVQAIVCRKLP